MEIPAFIAVLLAEVLLMASLIYSLANPSHRIWPPPRKKSWQFWWMWVLTEGSMLGVVIVSLLDWNSFVLHHWSRFIVGSVLVVGGLWLVLWGIRTLSIQASFGLKGQLVIQGPYRFSRNPQYVGTYAYLLGLPIMTNSLLSLILCLVGIFCFCLAVFIEEPWLREQFGAEYDDYCKRVRRFV